PPRPRLAGLQAQLAHDGADQLRPGRHAPRHQVRVDPPVPVRVIRIPERLLHIQRQYPASFRRRRFRRVPPFVEPGAGHLHPDAHFHDRRHVLMVRFPVSRILRVDELEFLGHRWSRAKYAAAFFMNSSSIFSSRVSRSSSRNRACSLTVSGGSSPAWSRRYRPTQFPRVPSLIPSSFATRAIGRDVSITIFTASSLNSGEKLFFGRGKNFTFPDCPS